MKNSKYISSVFVTSTLVAALTFSASAFAVDFIKLTVTNYGNIPEGAPRSNLDTAIGTLQDSINAEFPDIDLTPFTEGSARSAAIATSGVGTEYASDFDFGLLGVNAAIATDATLSQLIDLSSGTAANGNIPGAGGAISLTLGLSFKHLPSIPLFSQIFAPDRTRGYLGVFSKNMTINANGPADPDFKIGSTVFSAQGQYKLITGSSFALGTVKWGGVDVGAGLRYSKQSLEVLQPIDNIVIGGFNLGALGNGTATFAGTAVVGVNSSAFTVPVEISTSARLLHFLGVFAGTGADINIGSANSSLSINGPIDIDADGGDVGDVTASATANLSASGKPAFTNLKYFAGLQIEVVAVALSLQYTGAIIDSSKAINVGMKLFW